MTIIRPDQLFDLADRLLTESGGQQVYLRRSISSAYYGLFHSVAITIADHVAGAVRRQSAEWSLAARSIGHTKLNNVCQEILKPKPAARYRPYILPMTFGADMRGFCGAFIELQEKRHEADYNHALSFKVAEVRTVLATGRAALGRFRVAGTDEKRIFASLILFDPR